MARPRAPYVNRVKRKHPHAYTQPLHVNHQPTSEHPLLVAFTGRLASGKGTACDYVISQLNDPSLGYKMSWAMPLKLEAFDAIQSSAFPSPPLGEVWDVELASDPPRPANPLFVAAKAAFNAIPKCKTLLPTDSEKLAWINENKQALRPLLQWWGTEYRRSQDPDYWVKKGVEAVQAALASGKTCVVNDDTRFPNEANALITAGFTLVRILINETRQESFAVARDGTFDPAVRTHASETSLDAYYHPFTIQNNSYLPAFQRKVKAAVTQILNPKPQLKDYNCVKKSS